jgi:hypothetical protein
MKRPAALRRAPSRRRREAAAHSGFPAPDAQYMALLRGNQVASGDDRTPLYRTPHHQ